MPCCQDEMASIPQAAFATNKIRQREAARKFLECAQHDITPNYNDKYMNSIWGQYNRYSVHNLKKIMDNTATILNFSVQTESAPQANPPKLEKNYSGLSISFIPNKMYRPPVWQFNYEYPNENNEGDQHSNLNASLENWHSFSGMDKRELNTDQQGNGSNITHAESGPYAVPFTNRVHSIHRNRAYNASNNNHLLQSYQARTGAVDGRTLARQRQSGLITLENHANMIVAKMEQDPDLIEDSPESEELRKEALRDMPQCLTLKRCVKEKLSRSVNRKSKRKPISCWKSLKYKTDMLINKLWYDALKKIEGNFGSGVGSFFKFLRWIFILNSVISIVSFAFVVLPQITYSGDVNATTEDFHWHDVFTGESYRKNFIETEGGTKNVYAHKVFCGWDYSIATKDAARLKHRAIYNELKELLYDAVHKKEDRSCFQNFLIFGLQLSMHVMILFLLIGIGSLVWFLMEKATAEDWSPIITAIAVNVIMTFAPIFFSVFIK
ncbi:unnamed protein product [Callosobruchus maculatus]|uniref:Uncharacterized protein n=1 Tax=Callosobruchus maculatus TaxID=64391 RepID=A0A653DN92_CALMS|nr:unnamed protein product [Callosobruchus maculatus]